MPALANLAFPRLSEVVSTVHAKIMPNMNPVSSKSYGILIEDTVLGLDIPYKYKPLANNLWILEFSSLVVLFARKMRTEL